MDLFRKIGIGIVMIVPGFVFGGLLWSFSHSWLAILGLEIAMVILLWAILSGKFGGQEGHEAAHH
ncbi:MAG: hypothetical protein C4582_10935 [Desulfobacteraceae bacterium]|jgi:hypothetical protein|nr:MAG: hypothetical protein C4582_10935 [Desulfobacteraceae bacterium]